VTNCGLSPSPLRPTLLHPYAGTNHREGRGQGQICLLGAALSIYHYMCWVFYPVFHSFPIQLIPSSAL
jgi:hypothetical protein